MKADGASHRLERCLISRLSAWRIGVLAVVAAFPWAECNAEPATMGPPGPWDSVEFAVNSWGRPVTAWTMLADGSGSWTEAVADNGASPGEVRLVWHEFAAGVDGYRTVATILARLPDPAPNHQDCANLTNDLPYGTIRLTRGATTTEIAWNSGCIDDAYLRFIETLKAADTLVAGWGREGKILRSETARLGEAFACPGTGHRGRLRPLTWSGTAPD